MHIVNLPKCTYRSNPKYPRNVREGGWVFFRVARFLLNAYLEFWGTMKDKLTPAFTAPYTLMGDILGRQNEKIWVKWCVFDDKPMIFEDIFVNLRRKT